MQLITTTILALLLSAASLFAAAEPQSHTHIKHIISSWPDSPKQMGLLQVALNETAIATLYIKLSQTQATDLAWIKLHVSRAKHALDGAEYGDGGLGYGVIKAAKGITKHVILAAHAPDASVNVKVHSQRIVVGANNAVAVANQMLLICNSVSSAISTSQALALTRQLEQLAAILLAGEDVNDDGEISVFQKEGGLTLSKEQITYMARAEGLIKMQ
ncbi:MAG: hypothetical protein MJK10_17210 [Pseudomonadales bacterium]|nr:hypothetical protein [Pseudomonadales bacterium]NRA17874.1 hypothetical protein [Oceanospirillaceae bacterium]